MPKWRDPHPQESMGVAHPHPDLAAAFAEIAPDESAEARLKRFHALTALHPNHPGNADVAGRIADCRRRFPAARRALGDLIDSKPTGARAGADGGD